MRQERKRRYLPRQLSADQLFALTDRGADDCWRWTGSIDRDGYGKRGDWLVHRLAYWLTGGEIPDGMTVDHTCFTRSCVNPEHLRLLTHQENARLQRDAFKTHCKYGHEFTPENTYRPPKHPGQRSCRACGVARTRRYKAKVKTS